MQRFLDPDVLAGISSLDLLAKTVVDGFVAGLHRSPDFGFSQEFAEYRAVHPRGRPAPRGLEPVCAHRALLSQALSRRDQQPAYGAAGREQLDAVHLRPADEDGLRALHRGLAVLSRHPQPARRGGADRLRRRGTRVHPALHAAGAACAAFCRTGTRGAAGAHRFRQAAAALSEFSSSPRHRDRDLGFLRGCPKPLCAP